ncbi:unnamed protein product [Discosporangium mesarthrocarpum]
MIISPRIVLLGGILCASAAGYLRTGSTPLEDLESAVTFVRDTLLSPSCELWGDDCKKDDDCCGDLKCGNNDECKGDLSKFKIDIDFAGSYDNDFEDMVKDAMDRWEDVIKYVPCSVKNKKTLEIKVKLKNLSAGILGYAGPTESVKCGDKIIPIKGEMTINKRHLDDEDVLFETILHEAGHILGIGTISTWGTECSKCFRNGSGKLYKDNCPNAHKAYRKLVGKSVKDKVNIIEEDDCGHWSEDVFGNELMTPFSNGKAEPMSKLTVEVLADIGYIVNPKKADSYSLKDNKAVDPARTKLVDRRGDILKGAVHTVYNPDGSVEGRSIDGVPIYV